MQFAELNKALKGTGLIRTKARCPECERVFDLTDPTDCEEQS